jgi:putative endonuclease
MYFVYILKCSDGTYYCGYTNNLGKRLKSHNESKGGAHYTKTRRPVTLVYSEEFKTLSEALKREYKIKQLPKLKKEALIFEAKTRL